MQDLVDFVSARSEALRTASKPQIAQNCAEPDLTSSSPAHVSPNDSPYIYSDIALRRRWASALEAAKQRRVALATEIGRWT